ncbi:unnamed protein product, partial [Musa banksii]
SNRLLLCLSYLQWRPSLLCLSRRAKKEEQSLFSIGGTNAALVNSWSPSVLPGSVGLSFKYLDRLYSNKAVSS